MENRHQTFCIPTDDPEKWIFYAPLYRSAVVCNKSAINAINRVLNDGEKNKSIESLLSKLNVDPNSSPELPVIHHDGVPQPTEVTLLLSTGCNLRCDYCYASAGSSPGRNMTFKVAKHAINFVIRNAVLLESDEVRINFHGGGEPTVNWRTLVQATNYARQRSAEVGKKCSISATSNGVLEVEQIDWIVENMDSAGISFDGLPEIQDRNRYLVGGEGSSHHVERCLRAFDAAKFPYGLRMTVTRSDIPKLPESVSYIASNFSPVRIQIEPAYPMGKWKGKPSAETEDFIVYYRAAREIAGRAGLSVNYSAARIDVLSNHFCSVSQDGFSVNEDGDVTSCYEVFSSDSENSNSFFYGEESRNGEYQFDPTTLSDLRAQTVDKKPFCQGCFAKWHCSGDCLHRAIVSSEEGVFSGTDRCHITRELTKDLILERIGEGGGIWSE